MFRDFPWPSFHSRDRGRRTGRFLGLRDKTIPFPGRGTAFLSLARMSYGGDHITLGGMGLRKAAPVTGS